MKTYKRYCFLLPIIAVCVSIVTILTCFGITKAKNHVPDWMKICVISLTGYKMPERGVYIAGFSVIFVLFCILSHHLYTQLKCVFTTSYHCAFVFAISIGYIGFAGLLLHAIVPLQSDFVDVKSGTAKSNPQSLIHQMGAAIFFLCSYIHGVLIIICMCAKRLRLPFSRKSVVLKAVFLITGVIPTVLSLILHPTVQRHSEHNAEMFSAIVQWIAVFMLLGYFGTYAADIYALNNKSLMSESQHLNSAEPASDAKP